MRPLLLALPFALLPLTLAQAHQHAHKHDHTHAHALRAQTCAGGAAPP